MIMSLLKGAKKPTLILLAHLFACYSFADMGVYQGSFYKAEDTYKQYGVLPEGFITKNRKVYYDGIIYRDKISCNSIYSEQADCGTGKSHLFVKGNFYEDILPEEYDGYLYASGKRYLPKMEINDERITKFREEEKNRHKYNISFGHVNYIHKGVLYNGVGVKANRAMACEAYNEGANMCVDSDEIRVVGDLYTYRLENKEHTFFSNFTGFDGEVYYENDIRYSGEYCYNGTAYNNYTKGGHIFLCWRWADGYKSGPGWYSFWDQLSW